MIKVDLSHTVTPIPLEAYIQDVKTIDKKIKDRTGLGGDFLGWTTWFKDYDKNEFEREMAIHFNYVLLGKCTELWVFGGVVSCGMDREIGVAKKRRMKIRWFDHLMKEVNEYA